MGYFEEIQDMLMSEQPDPATAALVRDIAGHHGFFDYDDDDGYGEYWGDYDDDGDDYDDADGDFGPPAAGYQQTGTRAATADRLAQALGAPAARDAAASGSQVLLLACTEQWM